MKRYFFYKVAKIRILDITFMAMILALYLILDATTAWSFGPFYIGINIKYIPLFLLAAYTDWLRTFIVCGLATIICFFFPTNLDAAMPVAYIFDYTIPIMTPVLASFFAPRNYQKKWLYILTWVIIFIVQFLICMFSKATAGVLFYAAGNTTNKGVWAWSISVNAVNCVVDLGFFSLTVPAACYVLQPMRHKIYQTKSY